MIKTPIERLRLTGLLEGVSFLVLLGIAMPLKYLAGQPMAVRVVGMAHGVLFIGFCLALVLAARAQRWPLKRIALFFVAALLPFGPFVVDGKLREEDERADGSGD